MCTVLQRTPNMCRGSKAKNTTYKSWRQRSVSSAKLDKASQIFLIGVVRPTSGHVTAFRFMFVCWAVLKLPNKHTSLARMDVPEYTKLTEKSKPKVAEYRLTFLLRVRVVQISIFRPETGCPDWGFLYFPHLLQQNTKMVSKNKLRLFPSKSFSPLQLSSHGLYGCNSDRNVW